MKTQEEVNRWVNAFSNENQILRYNSSKPKKNKFKEFFSYFSEQVDDYGWFMVIVLWIFKTVIALVLIMFVLWAIDSSFLPQENGDGVVVEKYYKPSFMYFQTMHTGKNSLMTYPVTVPESFNLVIRINGLKDTYRTFESDYSKIKVGEHLKCTYNNGRIFNTIYIEDYE